jgi:cell division protein FtsW (lipid II flippase)
MSFDSFENFSTAMLLFGVVFIMMFIGGISIKKLGYCYLQFLFCGGWIRDDQNYSGRIDAQNI